MNMKKAFLALIMLGCAHLGLTTALLAAEELSCCEPFEQPHECCCECTPTASAQTVSDNNPLVTVNLNNTPNHQVRFQAANYVSDSQIFAASCSVCPKVVPMDFEVGFAQQITSWRYCYWVTGGATSGQSWCGSLQPCTQVWDRAPQSLNCPFYASSPAPFLPSSMVINECDSGGLILMQDRPGFWTASHDVFSEMINAGQVKLGVIRQILAECRMSACSETPWFNIAEASLVISEYWQTIPNSQSEYTSAVIAAAGGADWSTTLFAPFEEGKIYPWYSWTLPDECCKIEDPDCSSDFFDQHFTPSFQPVSCQLVTGCP